MDDGNSVTTKLLTLLNISATKIGKRKRVDDDFVPAEKLNKRKSVTIVTESPTEKSSEQEDVTAEKEVLDDEGGIPGKDEEEAANDNADDGVSHRKRLVTLLNHFSPQILLMRTNDISGPLRLYYRNLQELPLNKIIGKLQERNLASLGLQ